MADIMSKEQRSITMGKIQAKSKLENLFASALWRKGIRFRRNVRSLKGTPDIAIQKYKIVIFIDSCFWHACPYHFTRPKSNQEFWDKKIARNIQRDQEVTLYYEEKDWHIKRIWEHSIKSNFEETIRETADFICKIKRSS